jgi:hypothetical protein
VSTTAGLILTSTPAAVRLAWLVHEHVTIIGLAAATAAALEGACV